MDHRNEENHTLEFCFRLKITSSSPVAVELEGEGVVP